ncbi:MAG: ABC transporter permease, partial [Bacteroidota bacterium]
MSRSLYGRHFEDRSLSGVSLMLDPGVGVDEMVERVRRETAGLQELIVRSNRGLREASLDVFDRTFRITGVLRLLTILVAFVGVLSAFMSLQLERLREIAVMRAQGFTPREIRRDVTLQSMMGGFLSGIFAIPLGLLLAVVLVYVINKRSFGWTLQFIVSPEILLQAVIVGTLAALLAALYPAWRMASTSPAIALREE